MYTANTYSKEVELKEDLDGRLREYRAQHRGGDILQWQEKGIENLYNRLLSYYSILRVNLLAVMFSEKLALLQFVRDEEEMKQWERPSEVVYLLNKWIPVNPKYHSHAEEMLNWSAVTICTPSDIKQLPTSYGFHYRQDSIPCVDRFQWLFHRLEPQLPSRA